MPCECHLKRGEGPEGFMALSLRYAAGSGWHPAACRPALYMTMSPVFVSSFLDANFRFRGIHRARLLAVPQKRRLLDISKIHHRCQVF
jgi:hypothetical protein